MGAEQLRGFNVARRKGVGGCGVPGLRHQSRHAAVCPAPSHAECPTFQRLLRAAVAGELAPRVRQTRALPLKKKGGAGSTPGSDLQAACFHAPRKKRAVAIMRMCLVALMDGVCRSRMSIRKTSPAWPDISTT